MARTKAKRQDAKKRSVRGANRKSRSSKTIGRTTTKRRAEEEVSKRATNQTRESGSSTSSIVAPKTPGQLDDLIRGFDVATEVVRTSLDDLASALPQIIAVEANRDRMRRLGQLAANGVLHSIQRLATALEHAADTGALPESLTSMRNWPRIAIDHFCSEFEIEPVSTPGETLTVNSDQVKDFDWSADHPGELSFPVEVEVLRSGWKARDAVFVLPRVIRKLNAG